MKRMKAFIAVALMAVLVFALAACAKSEFNVTESTESKMTFQAVNTSKDVAVTTAELVVFDGDQVSITGNLTEGTIKIELFEITDEATIDNLPNTSEGAIVMANISNKDSQTVDMLPGSYLVRATCLEKANGTVDVEVV